LLAGRFFFAGAFFLAGAFFFTGAFFLATSASFRWLPMKEV